MPTITKEHIDHLITNGYDFSIGNTISKAITFYTDNFGKVFLSSLIANFIPLLSFITSPNIYRAYADVDANNDNQFNSIFNFDKTGQYILYLIIIMISFFIISLPLFYMGFQLGQYITEFSYSYSNGSNTSTYFEEVRPDIPPYFVAFEILYFIIITLGSTLLVFVLPLILFANNSATEAIGNSYKIAKQHIFKIFGLTFFAGIISILGIILCYIGLIFTIPLFTCVMYMLYKEVLFTDEAEQNIEEISGNYTN